MDTLIVIDRAPYGSWSGREAVDMAFSLAAFDQPVALLFTDAGVNWLRAGQDGSAIAQKTLEKNLAAAGIFGIERLMVEQSSLERYGLDDTLLIPGTQRASLDAELMQRFDHVVYL